MKRYSPSPLFFMPENGKTISYSPEKLQVFVSEEEMWEMSKRIKLDEKVIARISGRVLEVQNSRDDCSFCELIETCVIPMSEESWKTKGEFISQHENPSPKNIHCRFLSEEGVVKIEWNVMAREEVLQFIKKFME